MLLNSLFSNNSISAIKCLRGLYVVANRKVVIDNLISRECTGNFICQRYDISATLNSTVISKKIIRECNIIMCKIFLEAQSDTSPKKQASMHHSAIF